MGNVVLALVGVALFIIGLVIGIITALTYVALATLPDFLQALKNYVIGGIIAIAFMVIGGLLILVASKS